MRITALPIVLFVFLGLAAGGEAEAAKGHLKQCIETAVNGSKRLENREIFGHTFDCKPVHRTTLKDGKVRVVGVLVHDKIGYDDHVTYRFTVENGKVKEKSLHRKIKRGKGLTALFKKFLKEVQIPFLPQSVTDIAIDTAMEKADKEVMGNWIGASDRIIKLIAARTAKVGSPKQGGAP